jgi:hypothetical protein
MLPIIAAMDLQTYITRTCLEQDIYTFASAIREVKGACIDYCLPQFL